MAIAATLKKYLDDQRVSYEIVAHRQTGDSLHTAQAAHVSGDSVAKAVVLQDERGYVVAVLPATYKLKMGEVHAFTGRPHLKLVSEEALAGLFQDCELGAVPALAAAYGLEAVWDESLAVPASCTSRAAITNPLSGLAARIFARRWETETAARWANPYRSPPSFFLSLCVLPMINPTSGTLA